MIKTMRLMDELESRGLTFREYLTYLRIEYLRSLTQDQEQQPKRIFVERVLGERIGDLIEKSEFDPRHRQDLSMIASSNSHSWDDPQFHLEHIVDSNEELVRLFPNSDSDSVIAKGYYLSLMPLPLVMGNAEWLSKIIPRPDFFQDHPAKKNDPYGIFKKGAMVYRDGHYLGSQKFQRSFLMNVTNVCPHGCVDCYKGAFTRVRDTQFFTNLDEAVSTQSRLLVDYLNEQPLIQSVILSGGEPLLLSNDGIKQILEQFSRARYLAEFRICTGTLFQSEPFRIERNLLGILKEFELNTGVRVHFNTHLNHPSQFTPESLSAIYLLHQHGFPINSQVPLQEGVNVFRRNYERTIETLYTLAELQGKAGVRPYKYILHMNSGSLNYSVPLEFMLRIWGELKYRIDHPLPETWQPISMSVLCEEGNILLSPQMALGLRRTVFKKEGYVEYHIPVPDGGWFRYVDYKEPIMDTNP